MVGVKRSKAAGERSASKKLAPAELSKYELEDVEIPPGQYGQRLTSLRDKINRYNIRPKPNIAQHYDLPSGNAKDILDLPIYDNRDFRVVAAPSHENVRHKTAGAQGTTPVVAWKVLVRDHDAEKPKGKRPTVQLFAKRVGSQTATVFHENALEVSMFSLADVNALLLVACDILNRVPCELDLENWTNSRVGSGSAVRPFVESAAIYKALPTFDPSQLSVYFWSPHTKDANGIYSKVLLPSVKVDNQGNSRDAQSLAASIVLAKTDEHGWISNHKYQPQVTSGQINMNVADPPLSATPWYVNPTSMQHLDGRTAKAVRLLRYGKSKMQCMVGTADELARVFEDSIRPFVTTRNANLSMYGGIDGQPLFSRTLPAKTEGRQTTTYWNAITTLLFTPTSTTTRDKDLGGALRLDTPSHSLIALAYVKQAANLAAQQKRGALNARQDADIAMIEVLSGAVTIRQILDNFCPVSNDPDGDQHDHPCMGVCGRTYLHKDLFIDGQGRWLCVDDFAQTDKLQLVPSAVGVVRLRANNVIYADKKHKFAVRPLDEVVTPLNQQLRGQTSWVDTYDGKTQELTDAVWEDHPVSSRRGYLLSHPAQISVEKLVAFYVDTDGRVYSHHPSVIIITKLVFNLLKHVMPIGIMPFMGELARRALAKRNNKVYTSPDFATDDEFYASLYAAMDNAMMIHMQTPLRNESRASIHYSDSEYQAISSSWRSLVWDGNLPVGRVLQTPPDIRGRLPIPANRPHFPRWDGDRQAELDHIVDQLRDDDTGKFNPDGHNIPRGEDGAPWPYIKQEMPEDHDYNNLFDVMLAKFIMWNEDCDRDNETTESPDTILVEILVQWFRTGGKCHVLPCQMSSYIDHPLAGSLGRGLSLCDEDGGWLRDIVAGEWMRTGCLNLIPTDIYEHYDRRQSTVVHETWRANVMRYNFPITEGNIEEDLLEIVAGLPNESILWSKMQRVSAYRSVPHPKSWRDHIKLTRRYTYHGQNFATRPDRERVASGSAEVVEVGQELMEYLERFAEPESDDDIWETIGEEAEALARLAAVEEE